MQHILVVDDDVEITTLLTEYLARFGYAAHAAGDALSMRAQMAVHPIGLVVLDVMLPGTDGITLARELRERSRVPIIMLTARSNPYDCVLGLEMGADDYMGKPFEPRELVARIQTVLRRTRGESAPAPQEPDGVVRFDGCTLHSIERHLVSPQGVVGRCRTPNFSCSALSCVCRAAFSAATSSWSRREAGPWTHSSAASICWSRACAASSRTTRARPQ